MRQSMTGFAARRGEGAGQSWIWELRGVNGKSLDLRLRLPETIDGLEPEIRSRMTRAIARGNVQISLRLQGASGEPALAVDPHRLAAVLDAMADLGAAASARGLTLGDSSPAAILGLRGLLVETTGPADADALRAAVLDDFDAALASFVQMRREEGARLARLLASRISEVAALADAARTVLGPRAEAQAERLQTLVAKVTGASDAVDPARLAQELALIAVKSDISEELDRLDAHVEAARALLQNDGPIGRKFEFLTQEFNREANTLCAKSGDTELTRIGLELKAVIDQMREQVANVE